MKILLKNLRFSLILIGLIGFTAIKSQTITVGGTNPDFRTINEALTALNSGQVKASILEIRQGTYYETINLVNTGRIDDLTIKGINATISSASPTTFSLSGQINMITGLTIVNTSATGNAIYLDNSNWTTVDGCVFRSNGGTTVWFNEGFSYKFQNNEIYGGIIGLYLYGTDEPYIYNNTIEGAREGIVMEISKTIIDSNIIQKNEIYVESNTTAPAYGIHVKSPATYYSSVQISQNFVRAYGNNSIGIYVNENNHSSITQNLVYSTGTYGINVSSENSVEVINNSVSCNGGTALAITGDELRIINNSTYIYDAISTQSAAKIATRTFLTGTVTMYNNSFFNDNTVSTTTALSLTGYNANIISDYNDLYSTSGNLVNFSGANYNTLATWKNSSGKDANSISADPQYGDPALYGLDIYTTSPLVGKAYARYMPAVDRSGKTRQYNAIGAEEPSVRRYSTLEEDDDASLIIRSDNEQVTILNKSENTEQATIQLIEITKGTSIQAVEAEIKGEDSHTINITSLNPGFYTIVVKTPTKTVSGKFHKK